MVRGKMVDLLLPFRPRTGNILLLLPCSFYQSPMNFADFIGIRDDLHLEIIGNLDPLAAPVNLLDPLPLLRSEYAHGADVLLPFARILRHARLLISHRNEDDRSLQDPPFRVPRLLSPLLPACRSILPISGLSCGARPDRSRGSSFHPRLTSRRSVRSRGSSRIAQELIFRGYRNHPPGGRRCPPTSDANTSAFYHFRIEFEMIVFECYRLFFPPSNRPLHAQKPLSAHTNPIILFMPVSSER